jgi:3-hydroxyisobutyrate dehydrogenase
MLSVPILGGTTAVQRGEVTLIVAGIKIAYELAEPVLKDLSTQIFYLGSALVIKKFFYNLIDLL